MVTETPHIAKKLAPPRVIASVAAPSGWIAGIAARQHGVVTTAQLEAAGRGPSTIARRIERGELFRVHRGVYAVGHASLSSAGYYMAAVLRGGEGAALSHLAAADLHGCSRWPVRQVDVVRRGPPVRELDGMTIHRARNLIPRDVVHRHRIPVTSISRTALDLGDVLTPHQLAWVLHEAAFHRPLRLRAVEEVARRNRGRRAVSVLRQALQLHMGG